MKGILLLVCLFISQSGIFLYAQQKQTFTQMLKEKSPKGGFVIINHSSRIDSIVNALFVKNPASSTIMTQPPVVLSPRDSLQFDTLSIAKSYKKTEGFRVQIFSAGNSRTDKENALKVQSKFEELFPEHKAYTNFVSPRWVVRAGDFATRSEALLLIEKIKQANFTYEARVVKCTVLLPQY